MAITKIRQSQVKDLVEDLNAIKEQIKTFKPPIDLIVNLPLVDNNPGDMRVCLEDGNIYVWNDTNQEWSLSSGKGGAYTKTIILPITSDGQKEFETSIRFDETGALQTNNLNVSLHINGLLVSPACYEAKNVNEQMVIKWIDQDELLTEDELALTYYDTLEAVNSAGGKVDLSDYSTTEQMNEAIAQAVSRIDLSDYSTTEQMNEAIAQAVSRIDLSAYSTTEQMNAAITSEIQKIDFSNYITDQQLEAKGYAKIQQITQSDYDSLVSKDPYTIYIINE